MSSTNTTEPDFDDCTIDTCTITRSFYRYRIWLVPNIIFCGIFGLSLLLFLATRLVTRRAGVFTIAMGLGLVVEITGYVGRVLSYNDQWSSTAFIIQTTSLTFAPAFLAAGVYVCLRQIVRIFGSENSRIRPELYTKIFIPCDVICLITQSAGGTISAIAASNKDSTTTGDNIIIIGLALQVVTLFAFMALATDFGLRVILRKRRLGFAALDQNPALVALRGSPLFRGFLLALSVSTIAIFIRCVFRVAEFSGGYHGPLMARQDLFVALEGGMISLAVLALNLFHPALCFRGAEQAARFDDKASIRSSISDHNLIGGSLGTGMGGDPRGSFATPPRGPPAPGFRQQRGAGMGMRPYDGAGRPQSMAMRDDRDRVGRAV
ncbi:RTA1 like protein-domain-containing protein [Xylariaceae sp. FL0016]|nr:RTA1 like protein-domain-containing protein [Xylariaceae sp. FL0016]